MFTELWQLKTYPPVADDAELVAVLQGTATEPDTSAPKRKQIEKLLCHKEYVLQNHNRN